jgi:hypothetical protein
MSASGQGRSFFMSLKDNTPMSGPPPAESGIVSVVLMP